MRKTRPASGTRDYDVVIVGAGPAGASAARFLAEAGARVALVDAARFPRRKTCAGWVNEKAIREFRFLGPICRRIKASPFKRLVFHSPDLRETAQFACRKIVGYIVRREEFDAELLLAARKSGAQAILGRKVAAIEPGEHQMTAVLAGGHRVAGRILIGADGVHSAVARATRLRTQWPPDQLVVTLSKTIPLTARQRSSCFGDDAIHVALGFGLAPGYAWAFPGAAHASIGVGARGWDGRQLRPLYDAWVSGLRAKGLLPAGVSTGNPDGGAVPAGAALEFESHVGKRVILIGDAGGFASSATGEGIYPSIQSAAIATRCVLKAIEADRREIKTTPCQDELQAFQHLWRQQMAPYLQTPNVNLAFLLPLIYTNQEIADRFGRAFLFGENL
jgi:geranylgeranyl reductase family protein